MRFGLLPRYLLCVSVSCSAKQSRYLWVMSFITNKMDFHFSFFLFSNKLLTCHICVVTVNFLPLCFCAGYIDRLGVKTAALLCLKANFVRFFFSESWGSHQNSFLRGCSAADIKSNSVNFQPPCTLVTQFLIFNVRTLSKIILFFFN